MNERVARLDPNDHWRLVRLATPFLEQFGPRTERGERITGSWGQPDAEGVYEPTFTVDYTDRIGQLDAAWAEAEAALPASKPPWMLKLSTYVRDDGSPVVTAEAWAPMYQDAEQEFGDTPAAALLALAAALRARP